MLRSSGSSERVLVGAIVGLIMGAMAWAAAVAMMCRGTVPHAIGRILPFWFQEWYHSGRGDRVECCGGGLVGGEKD